MPKTPEVRLAEKLAELNAVGRDLAELDKQRDAKAVKRDELLVAIRKISGSPSLRDLGALGGVSHAWIRKLEDRAG